MGDECRPIAALTAAEGFVELYRREAGWVLRFCARQVLDPEAALDLCAETFAQALRSRGGFRGSTQAEARAWLLTIARRQVARYLKKGALDRRARDLRRRRRWWRPGMLVVVLPLGLAAAAVAATSAILVGDPVKNAPGARLNLNPKAGVGVIVGSGKLLGARAADPEGGPDWGLRMIRTSRGMGCLQLGRVVDGKLGLIGRDGAFGDDGKFDGAGRRSCSRPTASSRTAPGTSSSR